LIVELVPAMLSKAVKLVAVPPTDKIVPLTRHNPAVSVAVVSETILPVAADKLPVVIVDAARFVKLPTGVVTDATVQIPNSTRPDAAEIVEPMRVVTLPTVEETVAAVRLVKLPTGADMYPLVIVADVKFTMFPAVKLARLPNGAVNDPAVIVADVKFTRFPTVQDQMLLR